jgi:PAS domain S-box-containing protein
MKKRPRHQLQAILIAVLLTVPATLIRASLTPWLGDRAPFLPFFIVVLAAAWRGGFWPGLLATALSVLTGTYWFVTPGRTFFPDQASEWISVFSFLTTGALVSWGYDALLSARERAQMRERELDLITSRTPLLLTRCSRELRYVFVNRACAEFLGRPQEAIIGRPIVEVMGEDAFCAILPYVERVLAGEEVVFELEVPYASIGTRSMRVLYTPDRDADGRTVGWFGTISDVTERRRAEAALRESETRLSTFLDQLPVGAGLIDREGRYLVMNSILQRFVGDSIPSRDPRAAKHWRSWREDGELLEPARWPGARALRGETVSPGVDFLFTADDHHETWTRISSAPFRNVSGQVVGAITMVQDIDAVKRAEIAIRESEERFRLMADAAPVMIWLSGTDKLCTWFNKPWLEFVGRTMEQELGNGWAENVHPDDFDRCLMTYTTAFDARRNFSMEYRLRRRDGEFRWILDDGVPRFGPAGEFTGYIGSCIDITERRRVEERLRDADRRKDEFLAVLSHELRNPLAPVRTAAHYLKARNLPDADLNRSAEIIERQVGQMARLIDDLLDVSRISRGVIELRRETLDFAEVVEAAVDSCRGEIEARSQDLRVRLPERPVVFDADRHRLVQAVSNLLSNAAKYTPMGGRIELATRAQGSLLEVLVEDNGIGIPPNQLSEIFELFAQVDRSERQGLGIGLTLARQLVQLHGGSIEARSEGIGRGSTFIMRLPIRAGAAPTARAETRTASASEPRRILVADDNQDAAESLALVLEMAGHEVRTAFDGEAALRLAAEFRPAVAFLDIGMPQLTGYEVAIRIRQETWGRSVHLVALTGWGQESDRLTAQEAGFDEHLVKPVFPDVLTRLVAGIRTPRESQLAK